MHRKNQSSQCFNALRKAVYLIACVLTSLASLPLYTLIFFVFYVIKLVIRAHLFVTSNNRFQLLCSTDAISGIDLERCPSTFAFAFLVRTTINRETIYTLRDKLNHFILSGPYKKLASRLCSKYGFPCWENVSSSFDIKDHVKVYLDENAWDKTISENEITTIVGQMLSLQKHDSEKPDWEILLIPRVRTKVTLSEPGGEEHTCIIFKCNHSYMDGKSAIKFLQKCVFDDDKRLLIANEQQPFLQRLNVTAQVLFYGPMQLIKHLLNNGNKTIFHQSSSKTTFITRSKLRLGSGTLNKIRVALNCHTRSLIMYAFASALRQLAERNRVSTPETLKFGFTHTTSSNGLDAFSNSFCVMLSSLPLAGPGQLEKINELTRVSGDNFFEAELCYWLMKLCGLLPTFLLSRFRNLIVCPCAITFNPVTERHLKFQNDSVEFVFAMGPIMDGVEYYATVTTYRGCPSVTFRVAMSPLIQNEYDFWNFVQEFDNALLELEAEANKVIAKTKMNIMENVDDEL